MSKNVEDFKGLYNKGYRCIHTEKGEENTYTLRNFDYGKIGSITSANAMEIGEIEDFLDHVKQVQAKTGHDCICTGCETDD